MLIPNVKTPRMISVAKELHGSSLHSSRNDTVHTFIRVQNNSLTRDILETHCLSGNFIFVWKKCLDVALSKSKIYWKTVDLNP